MTLGKKVRHLFDFKKAGRALSSVMLMAGLTWGTVANAEEPVEIHGFISQGWLKSTGNNFLGATSEPFGEFEFFEMGINFATSVTDDLRIGAQFFTRDLGPVGNNEISLDWAFADYTITDEFNIRAGRMKQSYGLYGEYWDLDLVRPSVVLPNSVYLMSLRDLLINFNGLQFYGNIDLWDYDLGSIDYKVGAGALLVQDAEQNSVAYFLDNRAYDDTTGTFAFQTKDIKDNFILNMSLQWNTPLDGLLLKYTGTWYDGLATLRIEDALFDAFKTIGLADNRTSQTVKLSLKDTFFWVASFEYTLDSAMIVGEYCRYWGMFASENPDLIPHTTLSQERFYLQASYRFSDLFEAATYYSVQYDPENRNSRGFVNGAQSEYGPNDNIGFNSYSGWTKDLAVSLRFDINYNWLVKLEGHVVDGTAVLYRIDNKDKEELERFWTFFGIKTTLTF